MRTKAIDPKYSAFVSASAGSGKTKILIDRLVNLFLHDVLPNKILCLAYTKAAANEIINRIEKRLYEFACCEESELIIKLSEIGYSEFSENLINKARSLLIKFIDAREQLNIQTIHSFAQNILIQFPFEANLSINFSLLDENEANLFIQKAKNILIENIENYPKAKESLSYISWHIKEYSLNELLVEIISNREKLDLFFTSNKNIFNELDDILDEQELTNEFLNSIPNWNKFIDLLMSGLKTDIARANKLEKFIGMSSAKQKIFLNDYLSCFLTASHEKAKSLITKKLAEEFPDLQVKLIEEQDRVLKYIQALCLLKEKNLTRSFIVIAYYIREIYKKLKVEASRLDYHDLIYFTKNLLDNSEYSEWIRFKLDGGIEHILIDEAQDASESQWSIIDKLSEEFNYNQNRSIFIVGDGKQSIFSFQGAAPEIFNELNNKFDKKAIKLNLNKSYRSGAKILSFVDRVFNQPRLKPFLVLKDQEINHSAHFAIEDDVELWPIIIDEQNSVETKPWSLPKDFNNDSSISVEEKFAKDLALYIKENYEYPSDVMILSRRRTALVKYIIRELQELNVPVNGFDRLKLLEHPIILDIISLIKFLLFPLDDLNLAIVLKSPVFEFSDQKIEELCCNRIGALWQQDFDKSLLMEFIELSNSLSVSEFFLEIFENQGLREKFYDYFAEETNFVIDSFLEIVEKFEKDNISSLQLFLDFLEGNKAEIKNDLSANKDEVKVMTIHAAKGLQAPVVILVDTISLPTEGGNIIWLEDNSPIWAGKEKYLSQFSLQAKERKFVEDYAEYIRLLYVALTRAERKLIITGISRKENISDNCWYSLLKNAHPLS